MACWILQKVMSNPFITGLSPGRAINPPFSSPVCVTEMFPHANNSLGSRFRSGNYTTVKNEWFGLADFDSREIAMKWIQHDVKFSTCHNAWKTHSYSGPQ
jgi:hypothetical protein